ncbi:MAG: hypothetical protein ACI4OB_06960 [Christensenellales bacterium]
MTKQEAKVLFEYYDSYIKKLMEAKIALIDGRISSYSIGDRSITRMNIKTLENDLDAAVKKRDEYRAIMEGRGTRSIVGIVPTDW